MNMALYYEFSDDGIKEQPATVKGTYLPEFKQIFDLYLDDSTAARTEVSAKTLNDSNAEFAMGEAVFYQNGTWIWADLKDEGMTPEQLGMIPIYIGAPGENNQGLSTGTENYWAINSQAPQEDQKATADFLKWVLTTETGKKALSIDMAFTTPFKSLSDMESDNPLIQIAVKDSDSGRTPVSWDFTMAPSETWKNNLGNAMLEYAQGTGDWDGVQTAFVDGWAKEYAIAHSND